MDIFDQNPDYTNQFHPLQKAEIITRNKALPPASTPFIRTIKYTNQPCNELQKFAGKNILAHKT